MSSFQRSNSSKTRLILGSSVFYCDTVPQSETPISSRKSKSWSCLGVTEKNATTCAGNPTPRFEDAFVDNLLSERDLYKGEVEHLQSVLKQTLKDYSILANFVIEADKLLSAVHEEVDSKSRHSCSDSRSILILSSMLETLKLESQVFSVRYGFLDPVTQTQSNVKSNALKRLSHDLSCVSSQDSCDTSFLELMGPKNLKSWVREGIVFSCRKQVWKFLLESQGVNQGRALITHREYRSLCSRVEGLEERVSRQIKCDATRCLTKNLEYQSAEKREQLSRVLKVFAFVHPDLGYCQSFGKIAAFSLLVLPERETFRTMEHIICNIMPADYYVNPMSAAKRDQFILKELVKMKVPAVHQHLTRLQIDIEGITFNWFHALFVGCFPLVVILALWDSFILEGRKVLFRLSLAVLHVLQWEILEITEETDLMQFLSKLEDHKFDVKLLRQVAFHSLNPFSWKLISDLEGKFEQQQLAVKHEVNGMI